jgi:hypothetical protein
MPLMEHPSRLAGGRVEFAKWSNLDALRAGGWTLDMLRDLGVKVGSENRLRRAVDLVRQCTGLSVRLGGPTSDTTVALSEALRTVFEQYMIVKYLNSVDDQARKKLGLMLKGPEVPVETGDDPGRDVQAELFSGVLLRGAEYRVDLGEPDLVISRGAKRLGVAVRRVKSDRGFRRRVVEAQRQLERQGLYGFIVVNPELLLYRLLRRGLMLRGISSELFELRGPNLVG